MMYYFNGEKRLRALTRANTAASLVGAPKRYLKRFLRIPEAGMRAAAFEQQHATRSGFRFAKRVVIKVGTPVATHIDGNIALGRIGALVEQIAQPVVGDDLGDVVGVQRAERLDAPVLLLRRERLQIR